MVKLKEGIVLTADEQRWFDETNALPRKASGRVAYYFKPQTKYPPRIYVFYHHESWPDRNRRPMGLHHARPFFDRPMSKEEIEYHHFDTRLCYRQYENWPELLRDESIATDELDEEELGRGTAILERLSTFRRVHALHPVDDNQAPIRPPEEIDLERPENDVLETVIRWQRWFPASTISRAINQEFTGRKRKMILTCLNHLFNQLDRPQKKLLTLEWIARKQQQSDDRSRRNFVRIVMKASPLFALEEIWLRYPGYSQSQLVIDLRQGKKKLKRKKKKPVLDFRRKQLEKLCTRFQSGALDDLEYHRTCNRIALLQSAHNDRLPIRLAVKLDGSEECYLFPWQTREEIIKAFVALANSAGMTHAKLDEERMKMASPTYVS